MWYHPSSGTPNENRALYTTLLKNLCSNRTTAAGWLLHLCGGELHQTNYEGQWSITYALSSLWLDAWKSYLMFKAVIFIVTYELKIYIFLKQVYRTFSPRQNCAFRELEQFSPAIKCLNLPSTYLQWILFNYQTLWVSQYC